MEALSKSPSGVSKVSCSIFDLDDRQFIKQTLDSLCCFLGLSRTATYDASYVKMEVMFGKPPSLQNLLQHPAKIGKLILALCRELGENENMKNTLYFRLVLRKAIYEAHPFLREHIDVILPLIKENS